MGQDTDRPRLADLAAALGLLTRLPLPAGWHVHGARGARAAWAWPLAGALVGGIAGAGGAAAIAVGIPPGVAAGTTLALAILLGGGLHEDGLADTADGIWGGGTPERRLAIMKDSRIGTYGTLALILSLGLRWSALTILLDLGAGWGAMIAAGALSRAPMAVMSWHLPSARGDGLSAGVGRPAAATVLLGLGLATAVALLSAGVGAIPGLALCGLIAWALSRLVRRTLGGQTGDILGAVQQLCEIAVLCALTATASP